MIFPGCFPPAIIFRRLVSGTFFLLKFAIFNRSKLKKLNRLNQSEKKYTRPTRRFHLPEYKPGMKYCTQNRQYLRPTRYCNSHAPEIIALADQLGAYRKSDRDFAEAAFEFIKHSIDIEILPLDNAENTLRRGTGTCLHRVALLVALCRTAGIMSRYKLYTLADSMDETVSDDRFGRQWNEELGNLLFHGEAEVYIDNEWIAGSIGLTAERQASRNLPITRFGEVALGVWYSVNPESIVQLESIPCGFDVLMKFVYRMAPKAIDNVNKNLQEQCARGRAILIEKGEQAYDAEARRNFKQPMPQAVMKERKEITFER